MAYVGLADSYQLLGEYNGMPISEAFSKSRAAAQKALEINQNLGEAHCSLAYTQAFYDWNWDEAEKSFKTLLEIDALFVPPEMAKETKAAYEKDGWKGFWQVRYRQNIEPPTNQFFSHYQRAISALRVDDTEGIFQWLQKAGENRERWFVNLKYDPEWDKIRNDTRFTEFIRKANLIP